jgi:hypothetical protein
VAEARSGRRQPTDKKGRPSGAAKRRFITRVKYNDAITGHAPPTAGRAYGKPIQEDLLKRYASSRGIACNSWGYFPLTTAFLLVSASITAAALNNI